ncbi:MAG: M24 family metallopeptidase [Acidobacteria bacterium]|nr:M24 family metallopeptidase [Acidobacteriota bacterium]
MRSGRLNEFMEKLPAGSVAVIPGGREVRRNGDTDFEFRQDSDFYFLTGINEPDCVAVIAPSHPRHRYVLFVRPRRREEEIWTGLRAGVEGAVHDFGADAAYDIARLDDLLPRYLEGAETLCYRFGLHDHFDQRIIATIRQLREMVRSGVYGPGTIVDPSLILHEMRLRKTDSELASLRRAASISATGHVAAMEACRPGMYEYELEAIVEYAFRRQGATCPAYPSIVGAGFNSTILHYNTNQEQIRDGDLVLIDAGAEYNGFAGDITRTFPANGRFTPAQQAVYEAVLHANEEVIRLVRPGVSFMALHELAVRVLATSLVDLGLLAGSPDEVIERGTYRKFFMHRTGHWLGMDVHDVGRYRTRDDWRTLEPGMVFTVEPGLYIAAGTDGVAEEFFNIGVRIEDDVVVTPTGAEVLTSEVPKAVAGIEKLMKGL